MNKLICRLFGHKPIYVKKQLDDTGLYWRFKFRCKRCKAVKEFIAGTPDETFVKEFYFGYLYRG